MIDTLRSALLILFCVNFLTGTQEKAPETEEEVVAGPTHYKKTNSAGFATAQTDISGHAYFLTKTYQKNVHVQVFDKFKAKGVPELTITFRESTVDQVHVDIVDEKNRLEPMVYHGNPMGEKPNSVISLVEDGSAYLIPTQGKDRFYIRVEKSNIDEFGTDFVTLVFFTNNRHEEYTPALELGGAVLKLEEFHLDTLTSIRIEEDPRCLSFKTISYNFVDKIEDSEFIFTLGFNTLTKSKHGIVGAWRVDRNNPNLTIARFEIFLSEIAKKHLVGPYRIEERYYFLEKYSLPASKEGGERVSAYHLGLFGEFTRCDRTTDIFIDEYNTAYGNNSNNSL